MPEINHDIEEAPDIVNTIILWRIYDVLSVLLAAVDPAGYETTMMLHEAGHFVTPDPSIAAESNDAIPE